MCAIICRRKEWRLVLLLLAFTLLYLYAIGIKLAWGAYWINAVLAINVGTAYCLIETKLKKAIVFNRSLFSLMVPIALALVIVATNQGFWISSFTCSICVPIMTVFLIYYLGMFDNRVTKWLGKYSYEIYLTHGTVMAIYPLIENNLTNQCWFTVVCLLATAALSVALNKISSKVYKIIDWPKPSNALNHK